MVERDDSARGKTLALSKLRLRGIPIAPSPQLLSTAALGVALAVTAASVVLTRPDGKGGARTVSVVLTDPAVFHTLPEFVADLKTTRAKAHFVQLAVVLEVPERALARVREEEVRIVSDVQSLLRDLERPELAGAAGAERLRREVLAIVDRHISPGKGRAVLFTKFLLD